MDKELQNLADEEILKYANVEVEKRLKREIVYLYRLLRFLRKNCPWDRVQNHESLEKHMIEEAYEVCDAIEKSDKINLKEELGDVLLQLVFHSILAEETDDFTIDDMILEESQKMIRRHKHLFFKEDTKTVDKTLENWDNIKRKEHSYNSCSDEMKDVPKIFPALMRSSKIQSKASRIGFDWNEIDGAFQKVKEEFNEVKEAYLENDQDHIEEEIGDLLFTVVNVSRFLEVDPEKALNRSTDKFMKRFEQVENMAEKQGKSLTEMSLKEMDNLWEKAKVVVSRNS